jgi:HD superfamily phosphohydrolase YqeK|tara:strand:- start:7 stop:261 length:255 start_codon:yes stop_codon:yes gene_type:complete
MTDSSSNPEMAEMAAELMMAKMDANKLTHMLRVGTFQLEIAPTSDMDVREFFRETLEALMEKYGDKLLEIDIRSTMQSNGNMHG